MFESFARLVGIHDALGAEMVQRAGFEALWLSSFELHAAACLPDADILGISHYAEAVNRICDRVSLPLVVDGDCGGGSPINTIRMVREYEKNGAAGMCVEDNVYPKRCSFYEGVKRELARPREHANKIRAAVDARKGRFVVIARIESFIVGNGLDDALERADIYADAGADVILIHSKDKTPSQVLSFSQAFCTRPVICVPTTYGAVNERMLRSGGISGVIYANAGIRAQIKAQTEVLRDISLGRCLNVAERKIAPMDAVYDLLNVNALRENERKYS